MHLKLVVPHLLARLKDENQYEEIQLNSANVAG